MSSELFRGVVQGWMEACGNGEGRGPSGTDEPTTTIAGLPRNLAGRGGGEASRVVRGALRVAGDGVATMGPGWGPSCIEQVGSK